MTQAITQTAECSRTRLEFKADGEVKEMTSFVQCSRTRLEFKGPTRCYDCIYTD